MIHNLDVNSLKNIDKVIKDNGYILKLYADYLINTPRAINKDNIKQFKSLDTKHAYLVLFSILLNLDITYNDRDLYQTYLIPSINELDYYKYINNPYYKNIKVPSIKNNNWSFKYQTYEPYELFVCSDLIVKSNLVEIPQLGYFTKKFSFPVILQDDNEWMLINPNEIETMQPIIDEVYGNVITFGLGMGYFAYMVSNKENVNRITIIERDSNVINLFKEYILPQFKYPNKIEIIKSDAFEYVKHQDLHEYDYAFVDLWHNAYDGEELYLKFKQYEKNNQKLRYRYWIEASIISRIRWKMYHEIQCCLNKTNSQTDYFNNLVINSLDDIYYYLSSDYIKNNI